MSAAAAAGWRGGSGRGGEGTARTIWGAEGTAAPWTALWLAGLILLLSLLPAGCGGDGGPALGAFAGATARVLLQALDDITAPAD